MKPTSPIRRLVAYANNRSIKTKLTVIFLVLICLYSFIDNLVVKLVLNQRLTAGLLDRATVNTNALLVSVTDAILSEDTNQLSAVLFSEKFSHADLAYALVTDENQVVVASTAINVEIPSVLKQPLPAGVQQRTNLIRFGNDDVYNIETAIEYNKGTLRVGYYKSVIDNEIRGIALLVLLFTVIPLLLGIPAMFWFSRKIIKPIDDLKESALKVQRGNLKQRAAVTAHDEIGLFAEVFNNMLDSIGKQQIELVRERDKANTIISSIHPLVTASLSSITNRGSSS